MTGNERIKEVEKNGYKYLDILEYNKIIERKMKEKSYVRIFEEDNVNREK